MSQTLILILSFICFCLFVLGFFFSLGGGGGRFILFLTTRGMFEQTLKRQDLRKI